MTPVADFDVLLGITRALTSAMGVALVAYLVLVVLPYLRHRPRPHGRAADFEWHFLLPCRDGEAVVGGTVRYLREAFPDAHVWVIDDDSDDGTVDVVHGFRDDPHVHLVRRRRPHARTGRGDALNDAYRTVKLWMGRHADADRAVAVVVDAGGRPARDCLDVCAAEHLFGDPGVGAVQVDVRVVNAGGRQAGGPRWRGVLGGLLVRVQDLELRTAVAAIRLSRGTTSPDSDGRFTRLSALDSVAGPAGRPWRGSSPEDPELGVRLLTAGWRTGFTTDTHVHREGLHSLRRLLAQRARTGHGTMRSLRHLRRIWSSPHLSPTGAAKLTCSLVRPWSRLLATLVYPVPLLVLGQRAAHAPGEVWAWLVDGAWTSFAVHGMLGLLPFVLWGPVYRARCAPTTGLARAIGYGLLYAIYACACCLASWPAVARSARGRDRRAKTCGNTERIAADVALEH
ncbi:glycosyltransferase [Saccharothrix sp. 6-C]|uniref:glycosyltransferase n=1 Tax=Saccharothrix sp. 6-C TaxID=2781735 RepID=UPI001F3048FB|nr:glycosyltransferase [Saccharothrix sp. 6-C]